MKHGLFTLLLLHLLTCSFAQKQVQHYIFFAGERERIREKDFLENSNIEGAQLKYTWRELEPDMNEYALNLIQQDLDFLTSKGKKLFVQIQDVSFDTMWKCVPRYIMKDKQYNGGANIQYDTGDEDANPKQQGWVARRWDPAVQDRFFRLLFILGREFDGKIEGINLPETSVGFGATGKLYPPGYTPEIYKNAILKYMETLKMAFRKSVAMLYANFMPGEWLPGNDRTYMKQVFALAKEKGIAMGGPDIKLFNKGHENHIYKFLKENASVLITGLAVQDGNFDIANPETSKKVSVEDIFGYAKNQLQLNYIFWGTEEPYYRSEVLPFLKKLR